MRLKGIEKYTKNELLKKNNEFQKLIDEYIIEYDQFKFLLDAFIKTINDQLDNKRNKSICISEKFVKKFLLILKNDHATVCTDRVGLDIIINAILVSFMRTGIKLEESSE